MKCVCCGDRITKKNLVKVYGGYSSRTCKVCKNKKTNKYNKNRKELLKKWNII